MRRGVWFRVLNRGERGIIDLTIDCVERIRSLKLARIVVMIVNKLMDAVKGKLWRLMAEVGRPLAQKLSRIVRSWGNKSAVRWAWDLSFVRYLTVTYMNMPAMFII